MLLKIAMQMILGRIRNFDGAIPLMIVIVIVAVAKVILPLSAFSICHSV
jgi:hypothetical protein